MPRDKDPAFRVGIGYDSHQFARGRPLILGGVSIPSDIGLDGHSDADAVCHAVTDAVLGAAGLGDIGALFPDSDPANENRDSTIAFRSRPLITRRTMMKMVSSVAGMYA